MDYNFLLMRHAHSKHNMEKDKWKSECGDKSYKTKPEFKSIKYNPDFIDSKDIIIQQCLEAKQKHINFDTITLIITSPLRRCLETCKNLIQGRTEEFKVIVEPLLTSRITNAWSVGSNVSDLKHQYPFFDFSNLRDYEQFWVMKILEQKRIQNIEEIDQNNQSAQKQLLNHIHKQGGETYPQFMKRTKKLKGRLLQIMKKHGPCDPSRKDVLIISHSCVMNFLLGKQLNEKGKVANKVQFQHCVPRKFPCSQILDSNISEPCPEQNT